MYTYALNVPLDVKFQKTCRSWTSKYKKQVSMQKGMACRRPRTSLDVSSERLMDFNPFREMPSEGQWAFLVAFLFIFVLGLCRSVGGLFPLDVPNGRLKTITAAGGKRSVRQPAIYLRSWWFWESNCNFIDFISGFSVDSNGSHNNWAARTL